jgi:hypothetical protein
MRRRRGRRRRERRRRGRRKKGRRKKAAISLTSSPVALLLLVCPGSPLLCHQPQGSCTLRLVWLGTALWQKLRSTGKQPGNNDTPEIYPKEQ